MGVVVLGAAGRLGRLLRRVFPHDAVWLTRQDVDIEDGAALRAAVRGAEAVLCLAGITRGHTDPMALNADLALQTLDAARDAGAGRVFLFSSAAVYGRVEGCVTEQGDTAPLDPYGIAKRQMEHNAAEHAHSHCILRLGNVAGADSILGGWRPGFQLDAFADGTTPRRSYIGPVRLAQVLADLCSRPDVPPLINVAAPGTVQMGALLDAAGLPWDPRPADRNTIAEVHLCTKTLERLCTFQSQDSTAAGLVADWRAARTAT